MKTRNVWILAALLCGQIGVQAQEALPKEVKVGKERIKARHEICLPQIDDYQLLKCDFHIHTIFSDGIVWPSLRVQEAWEEGLDAIAITDHIEGQPARRGLQTGNHNYSFDAAREEAFRRNIILIKGGEITRSMPPGHLNALFVEDLNVLDQKDYMKAIEEAHNQGAFIQWNHPGWGVNEIKWHDVHEELYKKGWLNGIEVFNEFEWYPVALDWVNEKNLTLLGNTDVHDVIERLYDFQTTTHRPMTLVLAKERTEEGIKDALFNRRTMVYFYDNLMGKKEYVIDARIKGGERHMIMSNEYDRVFPMDIYPEYLLKAIIAGDIDRMEALGIYEVAPEDFALCEFVCSSKVEVQRIVRAGLDMLRAEMA